jgi:hypothetical protein
MTKKDFELIAQVLYSTKPASPTQHPQWVRTIGAFSEVLAQENPRFNIGKFEKACTTGEGIRKNIQAA